MDPSSLLYYAKIRHREILEENGVIEAQCKEESTSFIRGRWLGRIWHYCVQLVQMNKGYSRRKAKPNHIFDENCFESNTPMFTKPKRKRKVIS